LGPNALADIIICMGRWSEPSEVSTDQLQVGRQLAEAMDRSGAVLVVEVTLVGWS
jgi:hypothetical protein